MSDLHAYQWEFDRSAPLAEPGSLTFSVGVFQWLPKASGRGLKHSTTIRIKGYAVEPEKVYQLADELCQRLNRVQARIDQPPAWLQKQYSVPKPATLVIEKRTDRLTGAQVRAVRTKVLKRLLLPAGFVHAAAGTYVRHFGDQIHLIDFQPSRWGDNYTVNVGFHYAFVIGFFRGERLEPSEYQLLDCALRARIGDFIPGNIDVWFPYGSDREQLQRTFEQNSDLCISTFDSYAQKWRQPGKWLKEISAKTEVPEAHTGPWQLSYPLLFAASIAKELGDIDLACQYLEGFITTAQCEQWRLRFSKLARSVL